MFHIYRTGHFILTSKLNADHTPVEVTEVDIHPVKVLSIQSQMECYFMKHYI